MTEPLCQDVRVQLAGEAPLDEQARTHLETCEACTAFEAALSEVDRALDGLPVLDAPDALVAQVVDAAKNDATPAETGPRPERSEKRPPRRARRTVAWLLGTGTTLSVLVALLGTFALMRGAEDMQRPPLVTSEPAPASITLDGEAGDRISGKKETVLAKKGYFAQDKTVELPAAAQSPVSAGDLPAGKLGGLDHLSRQETFRADGKPTSGDVTTPRLPAAQSTLDLRTRDEDQKRAIGEARTKAEQVARSYERSKRSRKKAAAGRFDRGERTGEGWTKGEAANAEGESFLEERNRLDGLSFLPAGGYWSNTYVPGDPVYRLLGARLEGAGIEDAARPYPQPFDPPKSSALAVTMASDRAAIEGRTRMLVQVGLKGTPQRGRRRPSMNVALVLDAVGEISTGDARKLTALVTELAKSKEAGDRMSLFVAGKPGGLLVAPERFEYGTVAVAMQQILGERIQPSDRPSLSVVEATVAAIEHAAGAGDDTAPLGATAVLLLTHRALGADVPELASLAHQSAIAGVPVGAIGVGNAALPELDRIALAGQGNRRLLGDAAGAEALVARELGSVSRVVARAVRLRIRLAPGVKLVDVLGARRLDTLESARVKEAEKSIDLRLSRNLGIDADRGEDEDGIQIVIPSYYAGDEHVILLDVVAPGPGAVADVQVRYKDLVYLKNNVARARLAVRRGHRDPGPLQVAVLKNLVSHRVSEHLASASQSVALGDTASARRQLERGRGLISALEAARPTLAKDADLARDRSMLSAYLAALDREGPNLAPSLRFAAKAKILPPLPSSSH